MDFCLVSSIFFLETFFLGKNHENSIFSRKTSTVERLEGSNLRSPFFRLRQFSSIVEMIGFVSRPGGDRVWVTLKLRD